MCGNGSDGCVQLLNIERRRSGGRIFLVRKSDRCFKKNFVQIFDATNTTRERRHFILDKVVGQWAFRVFFVESICERQDIVDKNIQVI